LIGRRWDSSELDVILFRGGDCGADHCLVMAKVSESSVSSGKSSQEEFIIAAAIRPIQLQSKQIQSVKLIYI
jgi:hypothetical protein